MVRRTKSSRKPVCGKTDLDEEDGHAEGGEWGRRQENSAACEKRRSKRSGANANRKQGADRGFDFNAAACRVADGDGHE